VECPTRAAIMAKVRLRTPLDPLPLAIRMATTF
jgi:hypothetical protein